MKFITSKQLVVVGLLLQSGISSAYNDGKAIANAVNTFASNKKQDAEVLTVAEKDMMACHNSGRAEIAQLLANCGTI